MQFLPLIPPDHQWRPMLSPDDQQILHTYLSAGDTILTANRRLQRALTANAASEPYQAAPAIYAADDWINDQWLDLQDHGYPGAGRTLITPYQSRKLWQEVIDADPPSQGAISPIQLAAQAESAAQLVEEWAIDLQGAPLEQREEYATFARWFDQYRALLSARGLASSAYAKRVVQQALVDSLPTLPKIILYGFDDLSPRLSAICEAAAEVVEHWRPSTVAPTQALRTSATDTEGEIRAAALWSRSRLEQNPNGRVGIVVPRLTQYRPLVERMFSEVYESASWLPQEARRTPPFNFSAGVPLGSTPLVADALLLLNCNRSHISPDEWRRLLLSPFWGEGLDNNRRRLLLRLNRTSKMRLSISELRRAAGDAGVKPESTEGTGDSWPLGEALMAFTELARRQPRRQGYAAWAELFAHQLETLGWPGDRVLDSPEYQQHEHFFQLLDQLSQMDAVAPGPVTLYESLADLTELATQAVFQAQTKTSPVQILGLLEAAGLQFDHCWVMDLADTSWPPAAKPNPFIPLELQVKLNLPRSSAERELQYAQALTQRLQASAKEIVFSWPASEGDVHFQPSHLIRHLPALPLDQLVSHCHTPLRDYTVAIAQSAKFEWVDCSTAPPWPDLAAPLPGGTGAIALQALCPFNAFAVHRLGAFPQEQPTPGLNGAERGTILHELLANLWQTLQDQETLLATPPEQLDETINENSERVLQDWQRKRADVLHPRFFQLEKQRLGTLAKAWLRLESARPPFRVAGTEAQETIEFSTAAGTAKIIGRIDRIDALPSGKEMVIDYKTGSVTVNQWQGERPADLQLPLYALTQATRVQAIAFAEINARKTALTGIGQLAPEDGQIEGIVAPNAPRNSCLPEDWDEVLDYWRQAAGALIQEFLEGRCDTTIHNKSQAQYYRHLECLNRVLENDE